MPYSPPSSSTTGFGAFASGKFPVNTFGEDTAVVSTIETTILTMDTGIIYSIQGFLVTGQAAGRFKLKIDGITFATVRTTAAEMTKLITFEDGVINTSASMVITLTAYHEETATQAMAGNIFGYGEL